MCQLALFSWGNRFLWPLLDLGAGEASLAEEVIELVLRPYTHTRAHTHPWRRSLESSARHRKPRKPRFAACSVDFILTAFRFRCFRCSVFPCTAKYCHCSGSQLCSYAALADIPEDLVPTCRTGTGMRFQRGKKTRNTRAPGGSLGSVLMV